MREGEQRKDVAEEEEEEDDKAFSPYGLIGKITHVFFKYLFLSCGSQKSSTPLGIYLFSLYTAGDADDAFGVSCHCFYAFFMRIYNGFVYT